MSEPLFNIVLVNPQIPPNTGNIGRTCVGTGCRLHLVKPLGFDIDDRARRRAGLDYWPKLDLRVHESFQDFLTIYSGQEDRFFFTSSHGEHIYSEHSFSPGDFFIFGCETLGLSSEMRERYQERLMLIPYRDGEVRSFNLANAVSIILFEAWRQNDFC